MRTWLGTRERANTLDMLEALHELTLDAKETCPRLLLLPPSPAEIVDAAIQPVADGDPWPANTTAEESCFREPRTALRAWLDNHERGVTFFHGQNCSVILLFEALLKVILDGTTLFG